MEERNNELMKCEERIKEMRAEENKDQGSK
jgi:hypothetical protein